MKMDVVIISDAKNDYLRKLTEQAINTCGNHNIVIVESNKPVVYRSAQTIHPLEQFNYNLYLNIGAKVGNSEYIFFGNNDLIFHKNWDVEIIDAMKKFNIQSASPICPETHSQLGINVTRKIFGINTGRRVIKGYKCRELFCGWAYVWERRLYEEVGGFEKDFIFWCSDDSTIELLKRYKKEHALVTSSVVSHIGKGRNTLNSLEKDTYQKYTRDELHKFKQKYNRDIILPKYF